MKKILLVGGAGYVGGYMVDLLQQEYDVTVYDTLVYESRYLKDVNFIRGDIRDRALLTQILPNFDIVIWLAAIVGDGACAVDPFLTQAINEDAPKWLVDHFDGQIIYPSTCSVYGKNDAVLDETSPVNPLSVYASTKLAAEQYILQHRPDSLVFRLGTLFGKGDEHSRIRLDLVVNVLTQYACRGETLKVFGGKQWRPLLHVKDVAEAVSFGLCNQCVGVYNLALANYTISDLAKEVCAVVQEETAQTCQIQFTDISFEDQRNYQVDASRWESTGWIPQYSLRDGIREMVQIFKDRRLKNENDPVYSNQGYFADNYWRI